MGAAALLAAAWLLSLAPLALPWLLPPPERFAGLAVLPLVALPWLALAGLPLAAPRGLRRALAEGALALPPLIAAAALDRAAGPVPEQALTTLALVVLLLALLAAGAELGAARGRGALQALCWAALIALPPLLAQALGRIGAPLFGPLPAPLDWLSAAGPLGWAVRGVDPPAAGPAPGWTLALAALPLAIVLLAPARGGAQAAEER